MGLGEDFLDKEMHMTECSSGTWSGSWSDNFISNMRNLFIGNANNFGRSTILWNMALDENRGPRCQGGACCSTCRGVLTTPSHATDKDAIERNLEFYNLAHFSKLVPEGSRRLETTTSDGLLGAAFLLPAGNRVVLVVTNPDSGDKSVSVDVSGQGFEFTLPKGAASFAWDLGAPVPPTPPPTPTPPAPVALGSIISRQSGKCLELPSPSDGSRLAVQVCDGNRESQQWEFLNGRLQYAGVASSNFCADVIDGNLVNGQHLQVWDCNNNRQQKWGYNFANGRVSVNGQESLCMDLVDGGQSAGTPVQIWKCNDGNTNQQWVFATGSDSASLETIV